MARTNETPSGLKKSFVASVFAWYLLGAAQTIQILWQQAVTNPNFSGLYGMVIWQVVPLVLFCLAYALHPRKGDQMQRVFESMLMTMTGLLVWGVLAQALLYLTASLNFLGPGSYILTDLVVAVLAVVGFGLVVWYLVRTKRLK